MAKSERDTVRSGHLIESAKADGEVVLHLPKGFTKEDWVTKVARAKNARHAGIAARKGKHATFPTTRFTPQ